MFDTLSISRIDHEFKGVYEYCIKDGYRQLYLFNEVLYHDLRYLVSDTVQWGFSAHCLSFDDFLIKYQISRTPSNSEYYCRCRVNFYNLMNFLGVDFEITAMKSAELEHRHVNDFANDIIYRILHKE